ncbi:MAG: HlyC/CorC family transporter [Clostridia bacterium]|nr:HlyC/CorC family transporter [Clostridia bacterium]
MSTARIIIYIAVIFAMLVFSAFFSGSEIAFNTVNRMRLRKAAEEKNRAAKRALRISENFTWSLCAILIGNNLANIAASTCATSLFIWLFYSLTKSNGFDALASAVSTLIMTFIVLIFGEIIPKLLAKRYADRLAPALSIPVTVLTYLLFPAVALVTGAIWILRKIWGRDGGAGQSITEDELSTIIDTVEEEGVIDEDQSERLQSSLEFNDTSIEEIMTPRIDLVTIDIEDDRENIVKIIESSTFSRIPVYSDSIDDIIGILHLNHYFKEAVDKPEVDIAGLLMKPMFLHKTMKLPAALRHMREKKNHMAIVIDEYGGTLGVVTIEDILEEIVGDIWDESDEIVPEMTEIGEGRYEVSGDMNIDDFFYEIDYVTPPDFECDYSTVGGFAIQNLDADPHIGDTFDFDRLHVLVADMEDGLRVTKLIVTVDPLPDEDEEETSEQ